MSDDADPPSSSNPANSGDVADDAFIDVSLPGTAAASAATTVLHDFSTCTTKFAGLLPGGGFAFAVNTTTPTLIVSTTNLVLGASLQEYVATHLYLVPKLHASNQLDQVSSSDLEIVIEHGLSSTSSAAAAPGAGGKAAGNARYFLCAVVSADAALPDPDIVGTGKPPRAGGAPPPPPPPGTANLIGHDPALLAFLRNIDTRGGGGSAQLKASNAKRLPLDTPLTFPGIGTCMSYPDRKGNTVLLASAPLLANPALVARLYALTSASAPVFSNFDLAQAEGSAVSLVTFRANAPALAFAPVVSMETTTTPGGQEEEEDDDDAAAAAEGFAAKTPSKKKKKTPPPAAGGRLTPSQVLAIVSLMVVAALFALPTWLYGPRMYTFSVIQAAGMNQATVSGNPSGADAFNKGILITKGLLAFGYLLVGALVGTGLSGGGGGAWYSLLIAGILLAILLGTLTASIFYDITESANSVIRGMMDMHGVKDKSDMLEVFRYKYAT